MDECSNPDCDHTFGYDAGLDEPTEESDGHIQVTWNPEDEPSYLVETSVFYCSTSCLTADSETHPFDGGDE